MVLVRSALSRFAACGVLAVLVVAVFPAASFAQSRLELTGTVKDPSGAPVPGVTVTISAVGGTGRRNVVTDQAGQFRFDEVAAGQYEIVTDILGFKETRRSVTAAAGAPPIELTVEVAGLAESIIVRGARTSRSLMDTPGSVEVFDQDALESRPPLNGTNSLLELIPNLTSTGTSNLAPTVRGADGTGPAQGADAFFAGTRPRLNIQIDGRPASYNEVVFGNVGLWDAQQVEMFRGAQSTVQGRNAMAGSLIVRTADPTFKPEVKLRVGLGGFEERQVSAAVSGPIVKDRVAARFSVDRSSSESFAQGYQSYAGVEHPGDFDQLTIRGKVLIQPDAAKRFSTLVTVNHSDVTGPQVETVARPFDAHVSSFPAMRIFEPRTTGLVDETRWSANPSLSYEHTLAYTDLHVERRAPPGTGNGTIDGHEFVFEPRLRFGSSNRRIEGFGGLYFFSSRQDEAIDLFGGGTFKDKTDTVAGFGEFTVALPSRLALTLAGRFEQEHHERNGADGPFLINFDKTYNVFSPKVGLEWRATDAVSVGTVVLRGYNGGGAGFTYSPPFVSYTFDPEFVWTSESYVRTDLRGGTFSLTGNVFYSRYRDMQLPFDLNPDPNIWAFVVRNADAVSTYGTEVGMRWRPRAQLEAYASLGLLHAAITDYPGSSVEGHELALSPSVTSNLGLSYRNPRGFDASVDGRFSSSYFSSITNDPLGAVDGYGVANAQAGYTIRSIRISAYVKNLFDSGAVLRLEPGATRAGDVATILVPRRGGVALSWGF